MSFIRRTQGREERKEAGKKGRLGDKNFHLIARWRKEKSVLIRSTSETGGIYRKLWATSTSECWCKVTSRVRDGKSRRLIRSNRIRADGSRGDFGASRPSHSLNKLLGVQVNWCSLSHQTSQKIQMKEEKKRELAVNKKKIYKSGF